MAKQALYRKFRPNLWKNIVGQQLVVRTLQNQIKNDNSTHAYLFCGTRGTGKTSTAKLLAKTINCQNKQNIDNYIEPCNSCNSCEEINKNSSLDVIEIDAASNNGVDNIRDIIDEVKYAISGDTYRIYIIDEVHMLSIGAFNALLKTLEEPPEKVIFILATTDPQKIPQTILSRVQRFDFKRITENDIQETLTKYCLEENISINAEAIKYISTLADGAMRDALSLLDQARAFYYDEEITYDKIIEIVGGIDKIILIDLLEGILSRNTEKTLQVINDLTLKGKDILQIINDVISFLRDLITVKLTSDLYVGSETNRKLLTTLAEAFEKEQLILYIEQFTKLANETKYSSNKKVLLELLCIKLCNPLLIEGNDALISRIIAIEEKQKEIIEKGVSISTNFSNETSEFDTIEFNNSNQDSVQEFEECEEVLDIDENIDEVMQKNLNYLRSNFSSFVNRLKLPLVEKILRSASTVIYKDKITFLVDNNISKNILLNKTEEISENLNNFLNSQVDFTVLINSEIFIKKKNNQENKENLIKDIDFPVEDV